MIAKRKDKSDEVEKFVRLRLKEKVLQDLAVILFASSAEKFSSTESQGIVNSYMDYCLDGMNGSMSNANVNMNRYTKLYQILLQIKFRGYEKIITEFTEEEKFDRLQEVKKIAGDQESNLQKFEDMVLFSRIKRSEEMYISMLNKPSNPLAKTIIVGCLRAMLKLATLVRTKSG